VLILHHFIAATITTTATAAAVYWTLKCNVASRYGNAMYCSPVVAASLLLLTG